MSDVWSDDDDDLHLRINGHGEVSLILTDAQREMLRATAERYEEIFGYPPDRVIGPGPATPRIFDPANPDGAIRPETCDHPWDAIHYVDDSLTDTTRCGRCGVVLSVIERGTT